MSPFIDAVGRLGWPLAAVLIAVLFRGPLTSLLSRLTSVRAPGVELTSSEPKPSAQASLSANADAVKLTGVKTNEEELENFKSYGNGVLTVRLLEDSITEQLGKVGLHADGEVAVLLKRQLAAAQFLRNAETTYRLIFGSQILALKVVNINGSLSSEELLIYYQNAKESWGNAYSNHSFDQWTSFFLSQLLLAKDPNDGSYKMTIWGRDFLEWLVSAGASEFKIY